jgi:hypothetical protein
VNVLKYNFLMLCLLFWIPAVLAYVGRPDLRRAMRLAALCSLPFAFSEFLFYPDYWAPTFLFDLGDRLGFGIEDFLFVSALAANAVSIYGVLSSRTYAPQDAQISPGAPLKRIASILALVLVLVVFAMKLSIPMIYGCIAIMTLISAALMILRRDLFLPALISGIGLGVGYWILAAIYGWLYPGVFHTIWHTQALINVFLLGVPVEEILYGTTSGVAAVVFYGYAFGQRFVPLKEARKII